MPKTKGETKEVAELKARLAEIAACLTVALRDVHSDPDWCENNIGVALKMAKGEA